MTAAFVAQRLIALGSVPPGLYSDEASVGWNAWAIAHHGVDEHGTSFPLFFEAFGEYKNPLYVYLLAPFTWFLPLTAATVRLPAALCGLVAGGALSLAAYRLTASRVASMATLVTVGLTPWAVLDARVGVEAPAMLACLALAIWCMVQSEHATYAARWRVGAGAALALGVFAYSSGRLLILLLTAALLIIDRREWRRQLPVAASVAAAYALLASFAIRHPGALTQRFAGISIQSDNPGPVVLAARFVRNYLTYTGVPFLATHGDSTLRYATGFGGMLLVSSLPAIAAGIAVCVVRRHTVVPAFLLAGIALGPVPAALTNDATPQSLRAIGMLPFLLAVSGYGWSVILPWLLRRRMALVAAGTVAAIEAGGFFIDLYARYPDRAIAAFDTGELVAITDAHRLAAGHSVVLSTSLDQAYVMALFGLRPQPPSPEVHAASSGDNRAYHDAVLAPLGMLEGAPGEMATLARVGDVLVLAPADAPPAGAVEIERVTVSQQEGEVFAVGTPSPTTVTLAVLYRR